MDTSKRGLDPFIDLNAPNLLKMLHDVLNSGWLDNTVYHKKSTIICLKIILHKGHQFSGQI